MTVNLGAMADEVVKLYEKVEKIKEAAEAKTRPIKQQIADMEQTIQLAMQDAGLTAIEGKKAVIDLEDVEKVSIKDPAAFFAFVKKENAFQLLHKRVAMDSFRELKAIRKGRPIPGLQEVNIPTLKIRKAKS